jgi:hypothetical protein
MDKRTGREVVVVRKRRRLPSRSIANNSAVSSVAPEPSSDGSSELAQESLPAATTPPVVTEECTIVGYPSDAPSDDGRSRPTTVDAQARDG